jgi:hypothetical protein
MDENARRIRLANATASLTEWLAPLAFEALAPAQVTQLVTDRQARTGKGQACVTGSPRTTNVEIPVSLSVDLRRALRVH